MSLTCDFRDLGLLSRFIPNRVEDNLTHFCFLHSHRSPNLPSRQHAIDINMNLAIRLSGHRRHIEQEPCGPLSDRIRYFGPIESHDGHPDVLQMHFALRRPLTGLEGAKECSVTSYMA